MKSILASVFFATALLASSANAGGTYDGSKEDHYKKIKENNSAKYYSPGHKRESGESAKDYAPGQKKKHD